VAEATHALGVGPHVEFNGRKYPISPWTIEMTCQFEGWLEQQAFDAVERTRGFVSEDVYQRRLDTVTRLIASKQFASGSQAAADAAKTPAGMKFSTYLQLRPASPNITEKLVHEIWEAKQAEVLAKVEAANRDPDPPPAASSLQSVAN
jgi:hypothetical protein